MDDKLRDTLSNQLIKLADIMEGCEGKERDYYNREYRKVLKALHPEMFPSKKRKPTQSIIRTLMPCDCGEQGWKFMRYPDGVKIACKKCNRMSEIKKTNPEARDSWNATFKPNILKLDFK